MFFGELASLVRLLTSAATSLGRRFFSSQTLDAAQISLNIGKRIKPSPRPSQALSNSIFEG